MNFYPENFNYEEELGNTMFKPGQRLLIKDNTGNPSTPEKYEVVVIELLELDEYYGPEYLVYNPYMDNTEDPYGIPNTFRLTKWSLDKAVKENRIEAIIIGSHTELKFE